jgi:hypothetical protein
MGIKEQILKDAEAWALHASLRAEAVRLDEQYGTVEDAILMCMLHLWVLENLEEGNG